MSLKEKILAAKDSRVLESAEVPEWNDATVFFRVMSGAERDAFEESIIVGGAVDMTNISAKLLVRTLADEQGNRIFGDHEADDLGKKSSIVLRRLYPIAQRVNGLSKDDVDELVKNSESAHSAASS